MDLRLATLLLKAHYIFLVPWIVFSVPSSTLLDQQIFVAIVVAVAGLTGTFAKIKRLVVIASSSLVAILVGGKVMTDIVRSGPPDTAVLLLQFVVTIFLMEATFPIVDYETEIAPLRSHDDEFSLQMVSRIEQWLKHQLAGDGKLGVSCFLMSLGLLTLGGLASIRVGQLALIAALVLGAVLSLFVLLTYKREPEATKHRPG